MRKVGGVKTREVSTGHSNTRELPVSSTEIESIITDIQKSGISVIPNFFEASEIDEARAFCQQAVADSGGEYCAFIGNKTLPGRILKQLSTEEWFGKLCQELYAGLTRMQPPVIKFHQVLRCLSGQSGRAQSGYFHYDSYVITVLAPIAIPEQGEMGDLVLLPNRRRVRRFYISNMLEKAILDRSIVQRAINRFAKQSADLVRVHLTPGSLYFFCGYRSLHTNEPCRQDDLRATVLFHYGNPHEHSRFRRVIRRVTGTAA
jgi:hypothetical protein